jgi:threonine aldolase
VPDEVMAAIVAANRGYARAYGADAIMDRVRDQHPRDIRGARGRSLSGRHRHRRERPVAGAVLPALGQRVLPPRQSCRGQDECGAPEFYTGGAKLVLLDG